MKRSLIAISLFVLLGLGATTAKSQTIPYLKELLARNVEFNKLYNEKKRAGKSVPQIEALRQRGEQEFRKGNVTGLLQIFGEGMAILEGRPWDERQKFL